MSKYFFNQWLHKCWISNCACLYLFLLHKSFILVSPRWLLLQKFLLIKKWLGVSASKSFTLLLFAVNGLLLTIFSILVNTVIIWKLVKILSFITWSSDTFTIWTSLSRGPPICGKLGGLKFHLILCWSVKFFYLILIKFWMFQIQFPRCPFEIGSTIRHQCIGFASYIDEPLQCIQKWVCVKRFYQLQMNCPCYHTGK